MTDSLGLPQKHTALADRIVAGGKITAADVLTLRQGVFADGVVNGSLPRHTAAQCSSRLSR